MQTADLEHVSRSSSVPTPQPGTWRWIARLALLMGVLGAVVGILEGGLVGTIIGWNDLDHSCAWMLAVDRGLTLGLIGGILGLVIGSARCAFRAVRKTRR